MLSESAAASKRTIFPSERVKLSDSEPFVTVKESCAASAVFTVTFHVPFSPVKVMPAFSGTVSVLPAAARTV